MQIQVLTSHNKTRQYKMHNLSHTTKVQYIRKVPTQKDKDKENIMVSISIAAAALLDNFQHIIIIYFFESVFQALLLHQLSRISSYLTIWPKQFWHSNAFIIVMMMTQNTIWETISMRIALKSHEIGKYWWQMMRSADFTKKCILYKMRIPGNG